MTGVVLGELNAKLSWYVARASGLVAWAILTLSILWGLALSTRLIRRKGVPAWLLDLHKFLGTLSVAFVAVHIAALVADNYVYFGAKELFVPMASPWRPVAVAWGIVATYLLVAIQLTSWLMKKLPRKLWHSVHLTSFLLFVSATVHGFTAGADNKNVTIQWVCLTGGLLVFLLVAFRLLAPRKASRATAASRATTPARAARVAGEPAPARAVPAAPAAPAAPETVPAAAGTTTLPPTVTTLLDGSAETAAKVAALSEAVARARSAMRPPQHDDPPRDVPAQLERTHSPSRG